MNDNSTKLIKYIEKLIDGWAKDNHYERSKTEIEQLVNSKLSQNEWLDIGYACEGLSCYWVSLGAKKLINGDEQGWTDIFNGYLSLYLSLSIEFEDINLDNVFYEGELVSGKMHHMAILVFGFFLLFPEEVNLGRIKNIASLFANNPSYKDSQDVDVLFLHAFCRAILSQDEGLSNHEMAKNVFAQLEDFVSLNELEEVINRDQKRALDCYKKQASPYMEVPQYGFFPIHLVALARHYSEHHGTSAEQCFNDHYFIELKQYSEVNALLSSRPLKNFV